MIKRIVLVSLVGLLVSCVAGKQPTYLGVGSINVISVTKDTLKLRTIAHFRNDNELGGKLSTDDLEVYISGSPVGRIKVNEVDVPSHREFDIPMDISIPYNKSFGGNILGGVLNSVLRKENPKVMIRGGVNYRIGTYKKSYFINKVEELKIKG